MTNGVRHALVRQSVCCGVIRRDLDQAGFEGERLKGVPTGDKPKTRLAIFTEDDPRNRGVAMLLEQSGHPP